MKWLETRPRVYDQGMRLLTLGRLERLQAQILDRLVYDGVRVLELGCGTGVLTIAMARRDARISAVEIAPAMLAEAE